MGRNFETGFLNRSVKYDGENHLYQVYVPREYSASSKWPVVLFLHGYEERGQDGLKQTQVGLGSAIRYNMERWPAIVVFPQMPDGISWSGLPGRVSMAALEATITEFNIDCSRIYLTGISIGGRGVWQLAYKHPEKFAALIPICGFIESYESFTEFVPESDIGHHAYLARQLAHIPVWIFHGAVDPVIPVDCSRQIAMALKEVGVSVKYSELPDVGHNAWDPAYALENLPKWLLNQRKK